MAFKVISEDTCVRSDLTKVDCPAASLQEEKSVELFEERVVWLMDGAKDSLTCASEFPKETDDIESTLRVKTLCQ